MSDIAARLEPFLLLARSTKGAAAAKIIVDATAAPGVHVFSELLDLPNIQELANDPTYESHHRLLRLFAFGTLADYETNSSSYPPLSPAHILKLKHLTLVSLALQHRSLAYDLLLSSLKLESIRQLEDLVIDVIYAGLLGGKMHHHEKVLHVDWVAGRDLAEQELVNVQQGLQNWCKTAETLLSALDQQIDHVRHTSIAESQRQSEYRSTRDKDYAGIAADLRRSKSSSTWPAGLGAGGEGSFPTGGGGRGSYGQGLPAGSGIFTNPAMTNEALLAAVAGGGGGVGGSGSGGQASHYP
ncbi:hypothetical protein I316_00365 [Kwoniella heveanensis BCC8398]|uniref:PCI domain-containing protein n=1 Tax=Kwoniella heveanensis BCC8398 TaxID=1296120 RepID=A0A1B9H4E5_9TREE|nr:hypothetical protein I316_00365 [Kwoniella heveanensis BCC8398]